VHEAIVAKLGKGFNLPAADPPKPGRAAGMPEAAVQAALRIYHWCWKLRPLWR